MLEIFAERRLIGEVERVSDLLDILTRKTQQIFRFHQHEIVDPPGGRLAGDFLDEQRKIFWRYAQFVGIESDRPFLCEVNMGELDEIVDIGVAALPLAFRCRGVADMFVEERYKLVDDSGRYAGGNVGFDLLVDM